MGFATICSMFEQIPKTKEEILHIINEIETNPTSTQRSVSKKLGISLGKTNYILKELIKRGFIKGENFSANPGKIKKIGYLLTPAGIEEKTRLVYHFLKKKELEYNFLKEEWERSIANKAAETVTVTAEEPVIVKNEVNIESGALGMAEDTESPVKL